MIRGASAKKVNDVTRWERRRERQQDEGNEPESGDPRKHDGLCRPLSQDQYQTASFVPLEKTKQIAPWYVDQRTLEMTLMSVLGDFATF